MSKFLEPTTDVVFKSMWLKGNVYVKEYLERIVEYIIGHKIPEYKLGPNETGIISYKQIANKVDILLISCDNQSKINIEMNRLRKNPGISSINEVNNKSMVYLGNYINSFYNDLPQNERYKGKIKVEQVNFNNFYCEENKLIHELHFELVDKNYDITKDGIKIHQIYLPRMIEICYDKEEEIYRDFLLLMSKSYEEMEIIAKGNKAREEVVKFLKKLGADEEFMAVIDREEYNRILQETALEEERERAIQEGHQEGFEQGHNEGLKQGIEKGIEQGIEKGIQQGIEMNKRKSAISLYNNGATKDLICNSLEITEKQLEEYLK